MAPRKTAASAFKLNRIAAGIVGWQFMAEQHGHPPTLPSLTDSAAQAKRALGGRAFETIIMTVLTRFLESDGIVVVTGKPKALLDVIEDSANVAEIVSYTTLPVKRRCTQTQL